jgi:hypothetical protein
MIGEFFLDGKPYHFMWADDAPAPATQTLRMRPCALKPPVQVVLELIDTDQERKVANYTVKSADYIWPD